MRPAKQRAVLSLKTHLVCLFTLLKETWKKSIFPFLPNPTNYRGAVRTWKAHSFLGGGGLGCGRQVPGRKVGRVPSHSLVVQVWPKVQALYMKYLNLYMLVTN